MVGSYKIRDLTISPNLVLAPMSGVTTSAFRRLIKELNPGAVGLVITEFISVEALTRKVQRSIRMMSHDPMEHPFGIQIFGFDPNRMRDAALMCQDAGADLVDINCGCPAPKVVRKGGGCDLMRQPLHLSKIFHEVKKVLSVPLTMKMRSGWDDNSKNCTEIATMAESEGIEAIAVHGRTRAQMYRGDADWNIVGEVARSVKIPVLGSGDVVDLASATERFSKGVSGVFIGRGALRNPFIFTEITTGVARDLRHEEQVAVSILNRYIELLLAEFDPRGVVGKVKQLASQMCRGHEWRKPILLAAKLEEQQEVLKRVQNGDFKGTVDLIASPVIESIAGDAL